MSNKYPVHPSTGKQITFEDLNLSNKGVLTNFGDHLAKYKKKSGLTYEQIAQKCGSSDTMIFQFCKKTVPYCGISLLSRIALSCGSTLAEWVKPIEQPTAPNSPTTNG